MVFSKISPIFNNGTFNGTVSVARDITERKKAEQIIIEKNKELLALNEKIRENEYRLKTIIKNQGEGFAAMSFDENFVFTNPAACKIFGVPNGQLINRNLKEFVEEKEWQKVFEQTAKRKSDETSSYELEITTSNNKRRCLMVTASPDYDVNNKIIGTLGVFRDISDRKKAEEEIAKLSKIAEQLASLL